MLYPIGIQSFQLLRKEGFVYIDKTEMIYRMITSGQNYFLSRPRRFGKSLLVSTLECLFKGEKELFDGLWISDSDYKWKTYPIIALDFSLLETSTYEGLDRTLQDQLQRVSQQYGLGEIRKKTPPETLLELVYRLSGNQEGNVVILIDEYDKPIIDQLENLELTKQFQRLFNSFYANIKALGKYLRFTLITGVTKFTQVSLFSGMNNPIDLSFDSRYATLLGVTEQELQKHFSLEIAVIARENRQQHEEVHAIIKGWYNGYRFSGKRPDLSVYNPVSLMNYLSSHRLTNYWFTTGTPTFACKLIREQNFELPDFESDIPAGNYIESNHDLDNLDLITLLYQTGYLTIKNYDERSQRYNLGIPNEEIRRSLFEHLFNYFSELKNFRIDKFFMTIQKNLQDCDFNAFFESCNHLFSSIPYSIQIPKEAYYHSLIYLLVKLLGFNVNAEVMTGIGRIDMIVKQTDAIIIFEFKFNSTAKDALQQIKELKYTSPYLNTEKKVIIIGANFDSITRSINEWVGETIS